MGELSFRFIEKTQGPEAARSAANAVWQQIDAFAQCFDTLADNQFSGGVYGEQSGCTHQELLAEPEPVTFEQQVYQLAGRISVVAVIDGVPTIEHRNYWPDPEIPSDERLYVHVHNWTRDA